MGNALFKLNRYEEAIKIYTESLKIKPDYSEAQENRTLSLLEFGKLSLIDKKFHLENFYNSHCFLICFIIFCLCL